MPGKLVPLPPYMISQRKIFLDKIAQTSPEPMALEITRAKGCYLFGPGGKKYLDLIAGIGVNALGHGHPAVNRAIQKQVKKYTHIMVYGELVQTPQTKLAQLLCKHLPPSLNNVYYVNSGSEAIDGALKLAKRFTGKTGIVSCKSSYHGSGQGPLSIIGDEYFRNAYRPLLPDTRHIVFNDPAAIQSITCRTAAVVIEIVQGESGYYTADKEWIQAIRAKCNETGTLMILDEVQTGYGRTGSLFAFKQYDIVPDILCLAKGFGGGLPLGAFISSKEIMQSLTHQPVLGHITTFGGNALSCAASYATLKEILSGNFIQEAKTKGELFKKMLTHSRIKEVRGEGLMLAVEFDNPEFALKVIQTCIKNGVFTDWFLFNPSAMRISPPLIITPDEIKRACRIILRSIDEAQAQNA